MEPGQMRATRNRILPHPDGGRAPASSCHIIIRRNIPEGVPGGGPDSRQKPRLA